MRVSASVCLQLFAVTNVASLVLIAVIAVVAIVAVLVVAVSLLLLRHKIAFAHITHACTTPP
jgi:hypothetical protein